MLRSHLVKFILSLVYTSSLAFNYQVRLPLPRGHGVRLISATKGPSPPRTSPKFFVDIDNPEAQPIIHIEKSHQPKNGIAKKSDVLEKPPTSKDEVNDVVQKVWERHRRWSRLASMKKSVIHRARASSLVCSVCGALIQTMASSIEKSFPLSVSSRIPQLVGSLMLAMGPLIQTKYCSREMVREWYRSRAISEDIKAQVFRFRASIKPYDVPKQECLPLLIEEVASISESAKDMNKHYVMAKADEKQPPPELDREGYMKHRIEAQKNDFYLKYAKRLAQRSMWLRRIETFFGAGAALAGVLSATLKIPILCSATGLGATFSLAATSVATHLSASNYENQVEEWSSSAIQLENLQLRLAPTVQPGSLEWTNFVTECEETISATTNWWATNLKDIDDSSAKIRAASGSKPRSVKEATEEETQHHAQLLSRLSVK